jgi:protein TonB
MVRWLRPVYPMDWALGDMEGSVRLDLRIDPLGQPIATTVAQSSGSPRLDEAALRAASFWRFAPPVWKSQPVEVEGRVEVRFNFFRFGFSRPGEPVTKASSANAERRKRAEGESKLEYLGVVSNPEWRTYAIEPQHHSHPRARSVAVRWQLYRVEHESHTSLWKVAFDRTGRLWAARADVVLPPVADERSTSSCVIDPRT